MVLSWGIADTMVMIWGILDINGMILGTVSTMETPWNMAGTMVLIHSRL